MMVFVAVGALFAAVMDGTTLTAFLVAAAQTPRTVGFQHGGAQGSVGGRGRRWVEEMCGKTRVAPPRSHLAMLTRQELKDNLRDLMQIILREGERKSVRTRSHKKVGLPCEIIEVKRAMHPGMTRREIKSHILLLQRVVTR